MQEEFGRSALLLGGEALERLARARVAVFGVGGVGGHAAEALARAGVGKLTLFDSDVVARSNINRQIVAARSTVGLYKVDVMAARIRDISPVAEVRCERVFYTRENAGEFDLSLYDCIIDAIDTVSAKVELVVRAGEAGVPIVSAMGCGNRLDATQFRVADIFGTSGDPLARVMRRELRKRGVQSLRAVYSTAPVVEPRSESSCISPPAETKSSTKQAETGSGSLCISPPEGRGNTRKSPPPGSVSWVPGVAGMILAGEAVRILAGF